MRDGGRRARLGSPGKGPSRSERGPKVDPLVTATLCPPKRGDSVPLTPKWATAASESVYLQVIHGADPPTPASSHLWDLVASLGVGSGGGGPQVRPFPLYLPLPRPLGLVLKDSAPRPNLGQGRGGLEPPRSEGKGLLCSSSLPLIKGGVQTRWAGAPYWSAPGGGVLG